MIAPAPTDPDRAAKLDEQAYRTLFERLGQLSHLEALDSRGDARRPESHKGVSG